MWVGTVIGWSTSRCASSAFEKACSAGRGSTAAATRAGAVRATTTRRHARRAADEAERAAPEALCYNVIARETLREMLTRAKGGRVMQMLATRSGVLE